MSTEDGERSGRPKEFFESLLCKLFFDFLGFFHQFWSAYCSPIGIIGSSPGFFNTEDAQPSAATTSIRNCNMR
ncbi:hypothetical protein GWI33_004958 [Rhynchophorus ferrugineus]|uniref:Uncharacterized protein n=1 Tax=Rhynchophorus ferrugineus TaxID=354439 RepID=A0A834IK02_RHYFE|nr:hypothetical protein GWI33_004958 [Rhynchophorus ferrugineus]